MNTSTELTTNELVTSIVDVLDEIRSTNGLPQKTVQTCDHSFNSIHESIHGLALWLGELLEWAPLQPGTRANVARLAGVLTDADSGFHVGPNGASSTQKRESR